jgi:hypothetical protein
MPQFTVLRTDQHAQWEDILGRSFQHDFYHTPSYHALAERNGEGEARLFVYSEGSYGVALPLLLRPLEAVPGLEAAGAGRKDATSVYGYAGPVASHPDPPAAVRENFGRALRDALRDLGVVSVFARLHPLIPQAGWLAGLGECQTLGRTVSIDLTLPPDEQVRQYRTTRRQDVNKLRRMGVTCREDADGTHTRDFIDLYDDAMRRLGASDLYFFDRAYLEDLASHPDTHLFVSFFEQKPICACLVTVRAGILQHHLTGTHREFVKLSPFKVLVDTSRVWGTARGLRVCHLGGGVGAREDALFLFKAGFSPRRHDFQTWRWVAAPDVYNRLRDVKAEQDEREGRHCVSPQFFPAYRAPTAPRESSVSLP